MKEVLHAPAPAVPSAAWEGGPGRAEELARWPEDAAPEDARFLWRLELVLVEGAGELRAPPGLERLLAVASGGALDLAAVAGSAEAGARRLRHGDVARVPAGQGARLAPRGEVMLVDVLLRPGRARGEVQLTRLGARVLRERLAAPHVVLHALRGALVARIAGEEEPFELRPRESLWVRGLAGEDVELAGQTSDSLVLLARLSTSA